MRKEQGFTLIELLIVLAILGILIGIVAMSVGDLTTAATLRGMLAERETVQTAIDSWNTLDAIEVGVDVVDTFAQKSLEPEPEEWTKYLRRATKYEYMYDKDTEVLEVCNGDECITGLETGGGGGGGEGED